MKNIIDRIAMGAKIAGYLAKTVSTRLAIAALAVLAAGGAWADTQVAYSWDNLSASGQHNQSSTKVAWSITLPATAMSPSGSTVNITNLIFCSRNTTLSSNDPRYFKITVGTSDYTSGILNGTGAFSGQTVATTGTVGSYPKLEFKFTTPVPLVIGTSYTLTPLDQNQTFTSGTTTIGAKLVQSRDSRSAVTMGGQGDGYYPICIVQGYATISTRVFTSAPSGAAVNFSDLTWEEAGAAATLPTDGDYTDCIFDVTMPDGGALTLDADISNLSGFIVRGASASLVFDTTKSYSVTSWDFSGLSGNVTLANFPSTPTADNPILPAGGVVFTGSGTLTNAKVPYGSIPQSKSVTVSQNIEDADNGLQLAYNKGSFNFTGNNTIGRFVLGNQDDSVQVVNQLGGTTTVTGSTPPTSNLASVLLGHWSRTQITFNNYAGVFSALNASSRLGWNDTSAIWNVGRGSGSDTATVKVKGIKTGTDSTDGYTHTGAGTLNINSNGILELGEDGIEMARDAGRINLAGGTIKATADTQIANNKADRTILNQGKTTTLDTGNHTMTLSAPLSGSGQLTKTGSGDLIVTGSGTATGLTEIKGGRLILSGNEAKVGSGNFRIKPGQGNSATLAIVPGEGNTITLTSQYLVDSTDGNPYLEIGAGTVKYTRTGNNNGNGCTASCTINILSGGTFELAGGDLLGWNYSFPINVASGGKLLISARETFTRNLNLNGGTLEISGANSGRALDLHNGVGIITATADSAINGVATESVTEPLIWIRSADASMAVNAGATLSLNAVVASANDETRNLTKSGDGTLKLMKANTCAGNLNVSGGTLDFDVGGSWAGTISPAAGTTLKFESGAAPAVASLALPASGTVTVDVSALTLGASGTTLMTFTTAPSATDVASKMTAAGAVLKLENSALKAYPVATLTKGDDSVIPFSSVQEAVSATVNTLYTDYKYVTINVEGASVNAVDTTLKVKFGAGVTSVTVNSPRAEYASNSGVVDSETGIITYTLTPAATTYTWVATGDSAKSWSAPANWQYGASVGATRAPTAGDTVIFNNGALVTLDATTTIAGMTVNGAVSISASQKSLNLTGNVSGTGTLTLSDVCLANAKDGGVAVEPNVNFTNDSELAKTSDVAGGVTVNGNVTITGTFKPWDVTHVFAGSATIVSLDTANGNGAFVFTGPVTLHSTLTVDGSRIGLGASATVVLADVAASLADSRAEHISAERVTTTVADSYVKTTTSGSTTTYEVAANPTVTITPATPVFQDYTNATIVATVTADGTFDAEHATYTATVGNQSYNGTYANGSVTFEIPGSAGASANVTITAQDGGAAVSSTTAFVFGTATAWFEETAAKFTTGAWTHASADTTTGKIVLSGDANATFTPTKTMTGNTADVVWVVSFDAPNDDDLSEELIGAQTAFRLATANESYIFQLWVTNGSSGAWVDVAATGITPAINVEYTITNHFDYGTMKFTSSVNGQPLAAVTGGATSFDLPSGKTKVDSFEFAGSGALTGIAGNFINTMLYVDGDGNAYATLAAALASGKPVTALNPNMILTVEPGLKLTVPAGMDPENLKPTYNGASIAGYVKVSVAQDDGTVTLSATEAAKPSATAMTADGIAVGNVKPGLYYWVEASTTQNFTEKTVGTPVQATSEAAVTVAPTNPTGKVIFYRVAVDAEKPATP